MRQALVGIILLLLGGVAACGSHDTSQLDPEEQQWVQEEPALPPTGGPLHPPMAQPSSAASLAAMPAEALRGQGAVANQPVTPRANAAVVAPGRAATTPPPAPSPATISGSATAEHVTVTVYPSTIITCDGPVEMDYEHSKATFHDNVHVTDERGQVFADLMEVFFTQAHEISQVIATGRVRIVRGQDTTYSDRAVYLQQEGKVFLTGQPKVVLFPETEQRMLPADKPHGNTHTPHAAGSDAAAPQSEGTSARQAGAP